MMMVAASAGPGGLGPGALVLALVGGLLGCAALLVVALLCMGSGRHLLRVVRTAVGLGWPLVGLAGSHDPVRAEADRSLRDAVQDLRAAIEAEPTAIALARAAAYEDDVRWETERARERSRATRQVARDAAARRVAATLEKSQRRAAEERAERERRETAAALAELPPERAVAFREALNVITARIAPEPVEAVDAVAAAAAVDEVVGRAAAVTGPTVVDTRAAAIDLRPFETVTLSAANGSGGKRPGGGRTPNVAAGGEANLDVAAKAAAAHAAGVAKAAATAEAAAARWTAERPCWPLGRAVTQGAPLVRASAATQASRDRVLGTVGRLREQRRIEERRFARERWTLRAARLSLSAVFPVVAIDRVMGGGHLSWGVATGSVVLVLAGGAALWGRSPSRPARRLDPAERSAWRAVGSSEQLAVRVATGSSLQEAWVAVASSSDLSVVSAPPARALSEIVASAAWSRRRAARMSMSRARTRAVVALVPGGLVVLVAAALLLQA